MPKILIKIFRSIFVSFHIQDSKLEKNNLDFIINQNNNDDNNNNDNSYFPNIIISKEKLQKTVELNKNNILTISKELFKLYTQFIIILFRNGTENENKNIFKIFKKFYEKETDSILKASFPNNIYKFCDLFKTLFIPAMNSFNNEYKNKDRIISIKKYLSKNEIDGQKIGGNIQYIYEEYVPQISNFEDLLKYKINKYDNIIFIELLYLFFVKENNGNFWQFLTEIRILSYFYFPLNIIKLKE
jgi:hypothetical protein